MSRHKKNYVGKIGYCDNKVLGITDKYGKPINGGHYVYIREVVGNKCNVNVITSLEYSNGSYNSKKIRKVKEGKIYPIPKTDTNLTRWSAINLDGNINDIKISDIMNIGYKKMKQRHKWFVGKFSKKTKK